MKRVLLSAALGIAFLGVGAGGMYLYDRQHPRVVTHTITRIDTRTVTEPAASDPDLTGQWLNQANSTYTLRLIDTAGELSGSMLIPVDNGNGVGRPAQMPLTGSIQNGTINLTLDEGLGRISVSGELVASDTLRLEWTSSKGKLVEWIYRPARP
jgi:Avidin family